MRNGLVKIFAVVLVTAACAASGSAQAAPPPCPPVATSYDTGGAPGGGAANDPLFPRQWGLTQINAPAAWAKGGLGEGATIAIVDTGVDLGHPDLAGKFVPGVDLASSAPCSSAGGQDRNGHGTHVAGIAAALTNNGIGVAGTAPLARIMPVRVLDQDGGGSGDDVVAGIKWAADHGAQVINLSLSESDPIALPLDISGISSAVDYAFGKGAVVVAAAGNETFPFCDYPSMSRNAVCVAANDDTGFPSLFSNFPLRLDGGVAVRAPGGSGTGGCGDGDVWSTYWPGASDDICAPRGYEPLLGTSMATPFVSGLAAMLRGAGLTNQQVMTCLKQTSSNNGFYDPIRGYGTVDAGEAVARCTTLPLVASAPTAPQSAGNGGVNPSSGTSPGQTSPPAQQVKGERVAAKDTTRPRVRVRISADRRLHAARAGFVTVRVRLSESARVALALVSGRETAAGARNAVVLAKGLVRLGPGGHAVKLRLTSTGRRLLRARPVATVTLLALARDRAGNDGTAIAEGKIRR